MSPGLLINTLAIGLKGAIAAAFVSAAGLVCTVWCTFRATGLTSEDTRQGMHATSRAMGRGVNYSLKAAYVGANGIYVGARQVATLFERQPPLQGGPRRTPRNDSADDGDILARLAPTRAGSAAKRRIEPALLDDDFIEQPED